MASIWKTLPGHRDPYVYKGRTHTTQVGPPFKKPLIHRVVDCTETLGKRRESWQAYGMPKPVWYETDSPHGWVQPYGLHKEISAREGHFESAPFFLKNSIVGAQNKALSKVDEQLTVASNLFESWYERREVYTLLQTAGTELLDLVRNFKHPKYWKKKFKQSKAPTNLPAAWLTYQFGIVPLVGTIDTCLNSLAVPLPTTPIRGKGTFTHQRKLTWAGYYDTSFEYMVKYGCTAIPNPNPNVALANIGGLTMPFSTAWSVVPWGWAVDYFVNVSEVLQNFEVKHPGVTTTDWYITQVCKTTWTGVATKGVDPEVQTAFFKGHGYTMERDPIDRPDYQLHFNFPLLGSNKAANLFSAIALTLSGAKK